MHAFFIGVGEMEAPFDLTLERTRDGGSFATRRVEIRQGGRLLLAGHSSHHDGDGSDSGLIRVGVQSHACDMDVQTASLDHSMWLHREASANEWLLHVQTAPSMSQGRGFSRAGCAKARCFSASPRTGKRMRARCRGCKEGLLF